VIKDSLISLKIIKTFLFEFHIILRLNEKNMKRIDEIGYAKINNGVIIRITNKYFAYVDDGDFVIEGLEPIEKYLECLSESERELLNTNTGYNKEYDKYLSEYFNVLDLKEDLDFELLNEIIDLVDTKESISHYFHPILIQLSFNFDDDDDFEFNLNNFDFENGDFNSFLESEFSSFDDGMDTDEFNKRIRFRIENCEKVLLKMLEKDLLSVDGFTNLWKENGSPLDNYYIKNT